MRSRLQAALGANWEVFGVLWALLGCLLDHPGEPLDVLWELGGVLGGSWGILGGCLGHPWASMGSRKRKRAIMSVPVGSQMTNNSSKHAQGTPKDLQLASQNRPRVEISHIQRQKVNIQRQKACTPDMQRQRGNMQRQRGNATPKGRLTYNADGWQWGHSG